MRRPAGAPADASPPRRAVAVASPRHRRRLPVSRRRPDRQEEEGLRDPHRAVALPWPVPRRELAHGGVGLLRRWASSPSDVAGSPSKVCQKSEGQKLSIRTLLAHVEAYSEVRINT